ncbi:MAG: hypothetical protein GY706_14900 [Bacteroides sp.]|nr:hypothetical protein [Bacteroides sp.]
MVKLSALCPIVFGMPDYSTGINREYVQRFASSDSIYIQLHGDAGEVIDVEVVECKSGATASHRAREYAMASGGSVYECVLKPIAEVYRMNVKCREVCLQSGFVEITDDERMLRRLMKVEYGFSKNGNLFNTRFVEDGGGLYRFCFRVEGGFLADSDTYGLSNEFFRNQIQEPEQLYQFPYVKSRLTVGSATGVPGWVGTLLNAILCCEDVLIDGIPYVRSESSVPERVKIGGERYTLFQYTVEVERKLNDNVLLP